MSSLSTAVISFAIAAGVAGALAEATSGETARHAPEFPLAALAWAQTHCGATLAAAPGTPRIQYDDFMRVAAGYDAVRASNGLASACHRAVQTAQSITSSE